MSDCANVEMRELLPEYLAGTLVASVRSQVDTHLATCTACCAELATLRAVRQAFARGPAVDVAAIVAKLPRASARRPARSVTMLRIAAAISFISLGGISLVVARSFFTDEGSVAQIDSSRPMSDSGLMSTADATPVFSFAGGVGDLAAEDLEALLSAMESMEAVPSEEPDEIPLNGTGRGGL